MPGSGVVWECVLGGGLQRAWHPLPTDPRVSSGAVVSGMGLEVGTGRAEREQKGWSSVSVLGGGDKGGSLEGWGSGPEWVVCPPGSRTSYGQYNTVTPLPARGRFSYRIYSWFDDLPPAVLVG